MYSATKRKWKAFSAVLLTLFLLFGVTSSMVISTSGSTRHFEGSAQEYCNDLIEAGFPEDYAVALTEVHLLHPNWSFTPLLISKEQPLYTWNYIINQETRDPSNNLVPSGSSYLAYRSTTNTDRYDAGHYAASRATVEYFMDPRNFLNETDLFQFFDLSSTEGVEVESVEAVLAGTFMEGAYLENGKTYAEYFLELGSTVGINPVYLAVKVRQEQGVAGTSPIISGSCGSLLADYYRNGTQTSASGNSILTPSSGYSASELEQLNGLYNMFNVKASGNGLFSIYHNAMQRAKTGTASMSASWGGSAAWNTRWKSLYGGADFLRSDYIDCYQSTVYLQKFNVDSRAGDRNFWKQYMQSISGAMSEARTLYSSFASTGELDSSCSFLIPVYKGMPTSPAPDPANGACSAFATAPLKFSTGVAITQPAVRESENSPVYLSMEIPSGRTLNLSGTVFHSYGISGLEYRWNNGEWHRLSYTGNLQLSIPVDFSENTSHILTVRGIAAYDNDNSQRKCSYHFLCAVIYVNVVTPPSATLTLEEGEDVFTLTLLEGTYLELPTRSEEHFVGWLSDDGTLLPSGAGVTLERDTHYQAIFLDMTPVEGASVALSAGAPCLRFFAAMNADDYRTLTTLSEQAEIYAILQSEGGEEQVTAAARGEALAFGETWQMLSVDTRALDAQLSHLSFTASFAVTVTYADGTQKVILADGTPVTRNAATVAEAALQDTTVTYSPALSDALLHLVGRPS